jgi:hypothetical protein
METILNILSGRFGKKVLKPVYRKIWRIMIYGFLVIVLFYLFVQFLNFWDKVVDFLNHVIWG